MTTLAETIELEDGDLVSPAGQVRLAKNYIETAVLPHGVNLVRVNIDHHSVTWRTQSARPDSNDPARTFDCVWGGVITFDQTATVRSVRERVYCALFVECLRDLAHDIGEQLRAAGLECNPHADDLTATLGDVDSFEDACVHVNADELTRRLY